MEMAGAMVSASGRPMTTPTGLQSVFAGTLSLLTDYSASEARSPAQLARAATLSADGLTLSCYTDKPCLQIYSGNYMEGDTPLKGGVPLRVWHGICLETQYAPDSPNHGKAILRAGEPYDFTTVFVIE